MGKTLKCYGFCRKLLDDPIIQRKFHGWATVVWFVAAFPICVYLKDSVAFLVFVSVYAVVMGHWSTYQSCRVEEKQDAADS